MEPVVIQVLMLMITHLIISSILVFIINPLMTYRKMKKEGLTANQVVTKVKTEVTDPIVKTVDSKIMMLETTVNERVNDINLKIANSLEVQKGYIEENISEVEDKIDNIKFPEIPENIPDMKKITKLVDDMGEQLNKNMCTIDTNIPAHIESGIKKMEGRLYKAKGIDMQAHEKGMDVAKHVMVAEIENPTGEATPMMQIVRHFVQVAADADLIDPENADQKIGLIQGIIQGIGMLQNRGKAPGNGGGFSPSSLSLPSTPSPHGNNMQYR